MNVSPQYLQWNGRSPLCTNTWRSKLELELNTLRQIRHVNPLMLSPFALLLSCCCCCWISGIDSLLCERMCNVKSCWDVNITSHIGHTYLRALLLSVDDWGSPNSSPDDDDDDEALLSWLSRWLSSVVVFNDTTDRSMVVAVSSFAFEKDDDDVFVVENMPESLWLINDDILGLILIVSSLVVWWWLLLLWRFDGSGHLTSIIWSSLTRID